MIVVADSGPLPYLILLENLTQFRAPLRETRGRNARTKRVPIPKHDGCRTHASATWTDTSSKSSGGLSAATVVTGRKRRLTIAI
jgi:hypothetical protein